MSQKEKLFRFLPILLSETAIGTDGKLKEDIQLLRVGEFYLSEGEKIEITKNHLLSMIKNFDDQVRGIDIMLDYSHESGGKAAAWFKKVYLSEDGNSLWTKVEWTPSGEEVVKNKEFRYVSSDFHFNYEDNETSKKFGPTLFGAALTNRPVIKRMEPITLSEKMGECKMSAENKEKEAEVSELADLKKKNKELSDEIAAMKKEKKCAEDKKVEDDKKLAEEAAVKAKNDAFTKMLSEGKVVEAQRVPYMANDLVKFAELAGEIKLAEKGGGSGDKEDVKTDSKTPAQDKVMTLAEKMVKDEKISLSESIKRVLASDKKLCEEYGKETN